MTFNFTIFWTGKNKSVKGFKGFVLVPDCRPDIGRIKEDRKRTGTGPFGLEG
jgi:hypothetical protein